MNLSNKLNMRLTENKYPDYIERYVWDRFNLFENTEFQESVPTFDDQLFRLRTPQKDNTSLLDTMIERAKELGIITLGWSGGVDSTAILSVYKMLAIPVRLITFDDDVCHNLKLFEAVKSEYEIETINGYDHPGYGEFYNGGGFDTLFYPHHRIRTTHFVNYYNPQTRRMSYASRKVPQKSLEEWMIECEFSPNEIDVAIKASKKFDVDLSTNNKIAYWITYCFAGHSECVYGEETFGLRQKFFCNTQRFNDISYTRYWQNNDVEGLQKKQDLKDIIKLAWGTDFGIEKNQ